MADRDGPVLDSTAIGRHLPHRYPLRMLDRVIERSPGRCVAIKNVTAGESYFSGHFPERAIMPGCLLLEAMAQTGAFIGEPPRETAAAAPGRTTKAFLLASEGRFLRPVVPGDQLVITAQLVGRSGGIVRFKCQAHVGAELVGSGKFMVQVSEEAASDGDDDG
jgi:3-hydroxymyristoyl/3-hydroxydecanoyl-(acyl carrier protein) dehydratase